MRRIKTIGLLCRSLLIELFQRPVVVNASLSIGYDGKPIHSNWGDDINYWFLKEISERPILIYNQSVLTRLLRRKHVLGIGSILGMFSTSKSIVWGSGFLDSTIERIEPPAEIRAVRGPYTRKKLMDMGIDCPEVYGDPALLISRWYHPKVLKKYKYGVISQYSKRQHNDAVSFFGNNPDVYYIEICQYDSWLSFVNEILQCEAILSSSLHGLIVAEAYGIPAVWIEFPSNNRNHHIKYQDFYASIGKEAVPYEAKDKVDFKVIDRLIAEWQPGRINLQPLIDCAPFKLKL